MNRLDHIRRAHIAIMQHPVFCAFAGVIACGKVTTPDIPTACTDGWNVEYGTIVDTLTDPERRFVVLHENMHKAYRHLHMWKVLFAENPQMANVACDYFVNTALHDLDDGDGFITMPKVGVPPTAKYKGWSVKQIYDDLKQSGQAFGSASGGSGGSGFDEHNWESSEGSNPDELTQAEEIQRAMRQGEIVRRKRSAKSAGGEDGVFGDLLAPRVDWKAVLREFVTSNCAGRDESTWQRPNRRYVGDGVYMPSTYSTTMSELVIGFDTSGSCFGTSTMTQFVSEIATLIADVNPSKCHVVYWDTRIAGHQTFTDGQFAVQSLKPKGGGGTDGSVLFDYLQEQRIRPDAIVQFSDGEVGSWGHTDVPTLWALTSNISAPFGTTIYLGD